MAGYALVDDRLNELEEREESRLGASFGESSKEGESGGGRRGIRVGNEVCGSRLVSLIAHSEPVSNAPPKNCRENSVGSSEKSSISSSVRQTRGKMKCSIREGIWGLSRAKVDLGLMLGRRKLRDRK